MLRYASLFDSLFTRGDQREWFRLYLQGLLTAPERKNVETIAAAVAHEVVGATNLAQALQHFISQSPWDHRRVFARYREGLPADVREEARAWVIHDGVTLKKGKNSVGTQRQMARSIQKKVNCQVAVIVGITGTRGYVPLATRLYLPNYWLRENAELVKKTVPEAVRPHLTKQEMALSLLAELQAEGWSAPFVAAEEGYRNADGFTEKLAERGVTVQENNELLSTGTDRFDWYKRRLGFDHYEGRTWTGWHHHAALVFAAAGFLIREPCRAVE